jgi:hypothetical protein
MKSMSGGGVSEQAAQQVRELGGTLTHDGEFVTIEAPPLILRVVFWRRSRVGFNKPMRKRCEA